MYAVFRKLATVIEYLLITSCHRLLLSVLEASIISFTGKSKHHLNLTSAGFCPHWSAVVGSNHRSAFLTTTQLMINSNYSIFNMGESLFS